MQTKNDAVVSKQAGYTCLKDRFLFKNIINQTVIWLTGGEFYCCLILFSWH